MKAGSAPDPSEARKKELQAQAREAAATAKRNGRQAHALVHRAARRPTKGVAVDARSAAAAALAFATRAGANAGIPEARAAEERARAAASRAAAAAEAAAEKELADGASAERPEEKLNDEDR
jgi:hypothetical protein